MNNFKLVVNNYEERIRQLEFENKRLKQNNAYISTKVLDKKYTIKQLREALQKYETEPTARAWTAFKLLGEDKSLEI